MPTEQMSAAQATVYKKGKADVDGRPVSYIEAGSGPALVVLHSGRGLGSTPTTDLLARRYRAILVEQPGFGTREPYAGPSALAEYAEIVHKAARQIAGGSYQLAGTSFGGRVAAWIAAQFPGDIEALALLSPAIITPAGFRLPGPGSDAVLPPLYSRPERQQLAETDPAVRARQAAICRQFLESADPALEGALAELSLPTLVVFGTEDQLLPSSLGRRYIELNSRFYLSFIYDAGHLFEDERPAAVANMLDEFFTYRERYHVSRVRGLIFP